MTCSGSYSVTSDFTAKFCETFDEGDEAQINRNLFMAAANIHAARAAAGACDCTLAPWAETYLIDLNCIIAAAFFHCHCFRLSEEEKAAYVLWANDQLALIRQGKLELCAGETGEEYPVTGWAAQGVTEFSRAQIIADDILRNA